MYETSKQVRQAKRYENNQRSSATQDAKRGERSRSGISTRGRGRGCEQGTDETYETKKENWVISGMH